MTTGILATLSTLWIDIISETFPGALLTVADSFEKIGPQTIPFRKGFLFFRSRFDNFFSNLSIYTVKYYVRKVEISPNFSVF